jgi:hypothetical protein
MIAVVVRQANVIVVAASTRTVTVTDTLGNTYAQSVASNDLPSSPDSDVRIFCAVSGSSGANTVTATFSGGGTTGRAEIVVWEVAGLDATTPQEATNKATGSSTTPSAGNVTTADGGFLLAALHTQNGYRTGSAGSGWTGTRGAIIWNEAYYQTRLTSSGGTYTGNFGLSPTDDWTAVVAAFRDGGDTSPPILTSPTGTGGLGVCSGSVSTDEGNGTLRAVATASATQPSIAQIKAGQDHTGAAALRVVSQSVTATGVQTIASGAITGGAGTRWLHYLHTDSAGNDSNRLSSASFEVTAQATSLVVTVPDAAGLTGYSAAVLSTSTPTTGSTVIKTATGLSFNGSGVTTIDITGLGVAIGARRWVTLTNSNGTTTQSPAPVAASGPVIAS